jgi:transposase
MAPVRKQMEARLQRAVDAGIELVSGSCDDILAHRQALWTFLSRDDVEPTNNHAEQEIRDFVLWRKRSFGAQSERGHRYAERVMTVAHTARKQNKNVFSFLTACCEAHLANATTPSLFAVELAA